MRKKILNAAAFALGIFCCANCGLSATARAELPPESGVRIYTAQAGDTFAMLAKRTGFEAELLAAMNNLSPGYYCRGGETLRLPEEDINARAALAARGSISDRGTTGSRLWQAPLQGVITSAFASKRAASPHHGIDIATDSGTPIRAARGGTVVEAGWKNSVYGYAVLIDHGNGWQTRYAHCSKVLVKAGDTIKQGQKIALVGSTGNSTGPHLHLEISKDGVYLNPNRYFSDLSV